MNLEAMTQTEVKDPPFGKIAEALLLITEGGRDQGHDQETIRVMLHTFGQTISAASSSSHISNTIAGVECKRRY